MKSLISVFASIVTACCASAAAPPPPAPINEPVIVSPADKQHIGVKDDPLCESDKPCTRIRAEGRVPEKLTPFFAVAPLQVSPRMFIQPRIPKVKRDGSFSSLVYLGEAQNGARQFFQIYLFACENANRFREGEEIVAVPADCAVSDPVEVFRER